MYKIYFCTSIIVLGSSPVLAPNSKPSEKDAIILQGRTKREGEILNKKVSTSYDSLKTR